MTTRRRALPPELLRAYLNAHYHINDRGIRLTLRIGEPSAALELLMRSQHTEAAAYLTACNPHSQPLAPEENQRRNRSLERDLQARARLILRGSSTDPRHLWPPEESFLALGLPLREARTLAARYEQNAFVWIGRNKIPRLILT
ncbi:MAG: DUF3293 domain-containing protein [Casimicrobiaceae bacterium]|nr:DUF3293 domain-containing protein [Casimicrobiaceae bacterium]